MDLIIGAQYIVDDPDNKTQRKDSIIQITEKFTDTKLYYSGFHYAYLVIKNTCPSVFNEQLKRGQWPTFPESCAFANHLKLLKDKEPEPVIAPEDHSDMLFN